MSESLNILIVGAGISGLTAAVGLREQGHEVTLFERSELAQEVGAALHIAPNCHGLLRRFGILPENFGANPVNGMAEYNPDGSVRLDIDLRKSLQIWQHPWVLCHRVRLHNELKRVATQLEGKGTPAILKTSSQVINVDTSTATVTLKDGSKFTGDLVLGADGVSSATRKAVVGDGYKPFSSGKSAFRFLVPHEKIRQDVATKHFVEREGYMSIWYGSDRRLVMYPCNNNTMMNFVGIHPSELSASTGEGWSRTASRETLLDVYKDFGPTVQALLSMADGSSIKAWTLLDMDRIPRWTTGRLALMGDAAHPFLPHQGQGGGVAIEDAAAICALLPPGTSKEDIPERLALYEKLRDERAHKIQQFTRIAGADITEDNRGKFNIMEFVKYNFGHDEWHNSTRALKELLWSRGGDVYKRQPLSFGPMTSPRQDHHGRPIASDKSRFTTHSIRFKTSATYLRTLFPTSSFSFASPGTIAEASFQCVELDGMKWLGGGGYNYFGLWIHGVQYTKKDGTKLSGSFLPVLFENLADPITTGREELGMPKLFCDIDVRKGERTTKVMCSWRGATFIEMELGGPSDAAPAANGEGTSSAPQQPADEGLLVYRYISAVGKRGEADAEYPVFMDSSKATTTRKVEKTAPAVTGRVRVYKGSWDTLPTLHHVAADLAEIPIYEVLEAKTEEGFGVEDLSHAERIE